MSGPKSTLQTLTRSFKEGRSRYFPFGKNAQLYSGLYQSGGNNAFAEYYQVQGKSAVLIPLYGRTSFLQRMT